jgi:hypothetical protein
VRRSGASLEETPTSTNVLLFARKPSGKGGRKDQEAAAVLGLHLASTLQQECSATAASVENSFWASPV